MGEMNARAKESLFARLKRSAFGDPFGLLPGDCRYPIKVFVVVKNRDIKRFGRCRNQEIGNRDPSMV